MNITTGFWWILLASALYGHIHSVLASNSAKRWADQKLGLATARRYYRLFYVVMAGITLLPVLVLFVLLPDAPIYTIPAPWHWLTLAVQGAALVGLAVTVMQTGALRFLGVEQWLSASRGADNAQAEKLVVSGLYRWVRHPIYTFSFVLLWLVPLMTWNLLALNLGLSAYMLLGAYFYEEPKLIEQFGRDYEAYRRRTPMIVPGLRFRKPE